ncbi:MAG: ATP-binding protein [Phycisphaerae bacterium]|nr:ATP-binding protein [Phycisphaerae bacterium]NUQ08050.1 DUF87 domain-containing protein [Phycisphaerae bacterium]
MMPRNPHRQPQQASSTRALDVLDLMQDPQLRLADRPWMLRTASHLLLNPGDPYLQESFRNGVEERLYSAASSSDAFYANYPPLGAHLSGDLVVVKLPSHVLPMRIDALGRNLAVVGPTGSGKTSLVILLLAQLAPRARVIVIDRKRELRKLAGVPQLGAFWTVLHWLQLSLALLQPPPGIAVDVWVSEVVSLVARSYSLYASQRLLLETLLRVYRKHGGNATLKHWLAEVNAFEAGRGFREQGYKEAARAVLVDLLHSVPGLKFAQTNLLEILFSQPNGGVVIECDSLPVQHYSFMVSYFLRWLYTWRLHSRSYEPQIVLVLDDATIALEEARDREAPGGVSPLAESMFMGRGLGLGVLCATHSWSTTSTRIRHNTETMIICGAQGDDLRSLSTAMGLTPEQANSLRVLQRGEAVVYAPSTWPAAVKGSYPLVASQIDDVELQARARAFMSKVVIIEETDKSSDPKPQDNLTPQMLRFLHAAAFHALLSLTSLYRESSLDRTQGKSVLSALHALGLVVPHRVSSGKRGGHMYFIEVTEQGWLELEQRGFSRSPKPTKGGFLHNLAALALEHDGKKQNCKVHFEAQVNAVFVDVLWQFPDGRLEAYQIGLSNPRYEAEKLHELVQAGGVASVVLITKDKVFLKKVNALLKGGLSDEQEQKLTLRCLGDLLNCDRE